MIPNQLVDRRKKVTPLLELLGIKGIKRNGKTDFANLLRTAFFQKLPYNPSLRRREFEKAPRIPCSSTVVSESWKAEFGEAFLLETLAILLHSRHFKTDLSNGFHVVQGGER
jgi:hypothetical protein